MERIDPYAFYQLALELHQLLGQGRGDVSRASGFYPLFAAQKAMNELLTRGNPVELGVSRHAAQDFKHKIDEIMRQYFSDEKGELRFPEEGDPPIPLWIWSTLRTYLQTFETVFRAEMLDATTYRIPQRGIYSMPALVDRAEESFPDDLRPMVTEKAKQDFHAAGRCLAFNLPTAAGFHVVRAVEAMLEEYYHLFTGKAGTLNGWNDYLTELDNAIAAQTTPAPDRKTLNILRQMKDDWRNPVAHPRVVLSEADARILFDTGEAAIMGMAQEIKQARSGVQLALMPSASAALAGSTP